MTQSNRYVPTTMHRHTVINKLRRTRGHEWAGYRGYVSINESGSVLDHSENFESLCERAVTNKNVWYTLPARTPARLVGTPGQYRLVAEQRRVYQHTHVDVPISDCFIAADDCLFEGTLTRCLISATACTFAELKECDLDGGGNHVDLATSSVVMGERTRVEALVDSVKEGMGGSVGLSLRSKVGPETFVDRNSLPSTS